MTRKRFDKLMRAAAAQCFAYLRANGTEPVSPGRVNTRHYKLPDGMTYNDVWAAMCKALDGICPVCTKREAETGHGPSPGAALPGLMMAGQKGSERMNAKRLRSLMVLHGDTNATLAEYLGITERSFSSKINENGTEFKQNEINAIRRKYGLSDEQVCSIFFN